MSTGSGTDEVYVPKLWYDSQLELLNDQSQGKFNYSIKNCSISTHYSCVSIRLVSTLGSFCNDIVMLYLKTKSA